MYTPRYGLRMARLFLHYRKKSARLPYLPFRLWVELTSHCNFRCIMCPNKELLKKDKGYMDFSLYKKIIDEASEFAFDINLAHRGESLLHPQVVEAVEYAKKKNLFTRLHTNGSILSEELSRRIVSSGLDRLSFSFDGYDSATYEKIRKGGNFQKTVGNIKRLLEIKKEAGTRKPGIAIEVINLDQLQGAEQSAAKSKFLSNFRNLPLDSFVHKELHNWAGEIKKPGGLSEYTVCTFPWNALIIYWDGAVLPCTQDFFGAYVIGNVKESSLKEIWNNEKMRSLRRKLSEKNLEGLEACAGCDRLHRKGFLGVPKEYLWKFITKRMP